MAEARIDKWMWAVRIFKTRTIAAEACKKGRVTINGALVKAARMVKPGDVIQVKKPPITYSFKVLQAIEKRIGAKLVPEMMENVNEILPKDKPRYLMGVGTPVNILEGIERGVDMFDCVMPTRNGRNGMLFTKDGIINMRNKKWEMDFSPIEVDGASSVDTLYSKAYLRHLFHAQELLAMQIASIHNLAFYLWLVGEARKHIIAGDFSTWKPMMVKRVSTRL